MSLILDALRKADSEREREAVPGLHTQPVPSLSLDDMAPTPRATPWRWIALASITLLVIALVWVLFGRSAPAPAPERAATADLPPMPAAPVPTPIAAPNAVVPNVPAMEPPKDIAPPAAWPAQDRKATARAPAKADAPAPVATLPAVYTREQLPENIRGALPPLAVSGSIYSNTPANRTLILDGRLYRENDLVATDLQLEEIGMKSAVLRFRGYRFEVRY